jgi:hypothetical protein
MEEELLGIKSANSTELHDMLTCQVDAHYLHMELESSLSKQMDRPKLKRHVCKIVYHTISVVATPLGAVGKFQ